jgi:hypothetical protein
MACKGSMLRLGAWCWTSPARCPSAQRCLSRPIILRRFDVQGVWVTMGGNGERLDDRLAVLPAVQSDEPPLELGISPPGPARPHRRLPADRGGPGHRRLDHALRSGVRHGDLTGTLWLALLVATLVEQAVINKATHGRFILRLQQLEERQRAVGDRGYRSGFRILAGAATAVLAVALYLPVDRLLGATSRLAWL